jgi:hypothetical protein
MSGSINLGIPDIAVVIRENSDINNVLVDVPNVSVTVNRQPDYKVSVQPSSTVVHRTGSLPQLAVSALYANTASYALAVSGSIDNSVSASYAQTASYALNAGAGAGFPYSGSAVITGSLQMVDTVNTGGITGSLYGTASVADAIDIIFAGTFETGSDTPIALQVGGTGNVISASYALTASYVANSNTSLPNGVISSSAQVQEALPLGMVSSSIGTANYIPLWQDTYRLTNSPLYYTASSILWGASNFFDNNAPDVLGIYAGVVNSYNLISAHGTVNKYLQINLRNFSTGSIASSDFVATSDTGNETTGYIDMGINSALYSGSHIYDTARDGYLYTIGNNLVIGTSTPSASASVTIFAGGDTYAAGKLRLRADGEHQLTGSLTTTTGINTPSVSNLNGTLDLITAGNNVRVLASNFAVPNGGISTGFNVVANTSVQTPILNNSGNGISINDNVSVTGSLTVSGSSTFTNIGPAIFSGSLNVTTGITGSFSGSFTGSVNGNTTSASYATTASYALNATSVPAGTISSSTQVKTNLPSGTVSSSTQINTGSFSGSITTASYATTASAATSITFTPSTASYALTASYATNATATVPAGTVSSSAQINTGSFTGSFIGSHTGSILAAGVVSSSAQYPGWVTSSTQIVNALPTGTLSSSAQLPAGTISSSTQITGYNIFATTGSNQFNGNQTITGSLTVTSASVVATAMTTNSSSLYLTSGSNLYLQNNGIAEITGSLNLSGSITITSGSVTMPNRPAFRIIGTGGPTTATTVISGSMVSVDYNEGGYYNTTNGTFTAPIAGLYQVNLVCRTYSNTGAFSQAVVVKNNTAGSNGTVQIMIEWGASTSMNHAGGSTISKLAVGDTLKAMVFAGTASFDGNDNFSVAYIG